MMMTDNLLSVLKKTFSMGLLIFSIVIVSGLIFQEQTSLSQQVHPALAFISMWGALIWLSMVEGSQASMVGLAPVDRHTYKDTHPISFHICEYGHRGDNLDRFLMGRQFMVLALVFVINMAASPSSAEDSTVQVLNLPAPLINLFLQSGLGMILFTCMIGQLNTQVNSSHCMLDCLNTHFATFTVYVAMGIESSGLLHASYLIQIIVSKLSGKAIDSNEQPRSGIESVLFWGRILFSLGFLMFALAVTFGAMADGQTTAWEGLPSTTSIVFFVILMCIVGMLEGMQIAFSAVAKISEEQRNVSPWAHSTCELLFGDEGCGLPGFMVGRQLCVVSCFFAIARLTTITHEEGAENILGVADSVQRFFETGFLGALITTIIASITSQLIASACPLAFLGNPLAYGLLRFCLFLDGTGIASASWILASIHKKIVGFQNDEVYIGTADERAADGHGDNIVLKNQVGHLAGGAFPANHELPFDGEIPFSSRRQNILANIATLMEQIRDEEITEEETQVFVECLDWEMSQLDRVNEEQARRANIITTTPIQDVESGRLLA
eukprot:CAMPEP_0172447638 /NCGR_PEP_ID=MMETSP1065-20121228/6913_1 /TAXON_ID=265537 /ORGANISM="Amphiprora paludosa, Strain CCMP125" /LENGTH=552 /DNA_ID=CAMNT_0013198997 /DNA_START=34 /DNA_END=1692 /DNA_ORIENTATION=-